jgi:hypothetical protein
MWTFFHGINAKKWRTHSFEQGIPCQLNNPEICCRVRSRSQTQRVISQLPKGIIFRLTLTEMGHLQPKTPVHCNNTTAVGMANNSMKRQWSRSMKMRFFWVGDKIAQDMYDVSWPPGMENKADYQSKITWDPTTSMSDRGIYTWKILPGTYPGLRVRAL